ncbi:MAG: class I SAM-dependent methyltransferase [Nitrososphaera sp.]|nr:class I SAM-dependent methyltransferase [Nitrososphaera sp.]
MTGAEKYYDLLASVYDEATEASGSWNPPDIIYESIKAKVSIHSRILDIGIGTGLSIDKIYNSGIYKAIYGVDVSAKMLNVCKHKYPNAKLTHISSIVDIGSIDEHFDIVIGSGTLEFIEDIDLLVQQVRCKQKKDGVFAFTYEPIIYFHTYQKDRKSLTVPDKSSSLYVQDFYTYRHEPYEILKLLDKNNYQVTRDSEFIAYKKGEEEIIYHVVVAICK